MITNGHMTESKTGVASLEDVDLTIFMAFCEFLYGGRYSTPPREELKEDEKPSPPDRSSENKSPAIVKRYRRENPSMTFLKQKYAESASALGFRGQTVDDYHFTNLWESFIFIGDDSLWRRPVGYGLLLHAKVYVFSTKYLIEELSRYCLGILHRELRCYSLAPENLHVIGDLLDYAYANTGRVEPNGESLLRDLVIRYTACKLPLLAQNSKFWEILESDSEMMADLLKEILK